MTDLSIPDLPEIHAVRYGIVNECVLDPQDSVSGSIWKLIFRICQSVASYKMKEIAEAMIESPYLSPDQKIRLSDMRLAPIVAYPLKEDGSMDKSKGRSAAVIAAERQVFAAHKNAYEKAFGEEYTRMMHLRQVVSNIIHDEFPEMLSNAEPSYPGFGGLEP